MAVCFARPSPARASIKHVKIEEIVQLHQSGNRSIAFTHLHARARAAAKQSEFIPPTSPPQLLPFSHSRTRAFFPRLHPSNLDRTTDCVSIGATTTPPSCRRRRRARHSGPGPSPHRWRRRSRRRRRRRASSSFARSALLVNTPTSAAPPARPAAATTTPPPPRAHWTPKSRP